MPNDPPDTRPTGQPWHAADEDAPPPGLQRKGAPVGTHSLTGGGAGVGMPVAREENAQRPERGRAEGAQEQARPDPLAEPRAGTAGGGAILGPKP
jgi:hypothetical protein